MNYEWLTPANVLWRVTFLIAGSKNLRAWTLVTATHSRLFFREQHSLRPRLLTAMQYPTRPWALFIQKKIWNYHRSTGRKERVLYASIWGRVLCITKHAECISLCFEMADVLNIFAAEEPYSSRSQFCLGLSHHSEQFLKAKLGWGVLLDTLSYLRSRI